MTQWVKNSHVNHVSIIIINEQVVVKHYETFVLSKIRIIYYDVIIYIISQTVIIS